MLLFPRMILWLMNWPKTMDCITKIEKDIKNNGAVLFFEKL